jgi:transcriptional regulator with XRE-family HTH domain
MREREKDPTTDILDALATFREPASQRQLHAHPFLYRHAGIEIKQSDAVRQLRETVNESQQPFSNRFGLTVKTISRYETGESTPAPKVLREFIAFAEAQGRKDLSWVFLSTLNDKLGAIAIEMLPDIRDYFSHVNSLLMELAMTTLTPEQGRLASEAMRLVRLMYDHVVDYTSNRKFRLAEKGGR